MSYLELYQNSLPKCKESDGCHDDNSIIEERQRNGVSQVQGHNVDYCHYFKLKFLR